MRKSFNYEIILYYFQKEIAWIRIQGSSGLRFLAGSRSGFNEYESESLTMWESAFNLYSSMCCLLPVITQWWFLRNIKFVCQIFGIPVLFSLGRRGTNRQLKVPIEVKISRTTSNQRLIICSSSKFISRYPLSLSLTSHTYLSLGTSYHYYLTM